MTCETYQEMISEFVDGELRAVETAGLFNHLAVCEQCRTFLSMMVRVRHSVATMPQPSVRPELDARVLQIPRRSPQGRAGKRVSLEWLWQNRVRLPFPALATLVFVALFSSAVLLFLWLRPKEPAEQTSPRVVYLIGLEPVEVQGSYSETPRLPQ